MGKSSLLVVLMLLASSLHAETINCNLSGKSLFSLINLDTKAKTAELKDTSGRSSAAKINAVRPSGNGKDKINIAMEYEIDNAPIHLDIIIVPVGEEEYRVGIAGYGGNGKKKVLDLVSEDKAMCF